MSLVWRYLPSVTLNGSQEVWHLREVYEDTEDSEHLSWIEEPMRPWGATYLELMRDVHHMTEAFVPQTYLDLRDPDNARIVRMGEDDG